MDNQDQAETGSRIHKTYGELQRQIKSERQKAKREALDKYAKGFLRSRGVWMVTVSDKDGLVAPYDENVYSGKTPTAAQFNALIRDVLARFPSVDSISFEGGWDFGKDLIDFTDGSYEPWVGEWSVVAWQRVAPPNIDELVRAHSGFDSMLDMVQAHESYRPSLATKRGKDDGERLELTLIADAYDAAQEERGDGRRAYRY